MNDDASIRRANLQRLVKARGWGAKQLHEAVDPDGAYSLWPQLLTNPKKSFGEKLARRIEERLSLPRGWLDSLDSTVPKEDVAKATLQAPGAFALEHAIELLAFALNGLEDAERERAVTALATLGRAPDSQRAKLAVHAALGSPATIAAIAKIGTLSEAALDLALMLDAIPEGPAKEKAHSAASFALSVQQANLDAAGATGVPTSPPAQPPAPRPRKTR
jgi:hypothetical protein